MQTIDDILQNFDNVYLWSNKTTLDFELKVEDNLKKESISFSCLICNDRLYEQNKNIINSITNLNTGINLKCKRCQLNWYLHFPIKIPLSLQQN